MNAPFSIWSQYYNTEEPEDAILEFEKDGVTHIELSHEHGSAILVREGDHRENGRKFKEFMAAHGIIATQGHLAFPSLIVCESETFIDYIVRQAELYEAIGIKCSVLHCDYMRGVEVTDEEKFEKNVAALKEVARRTAHIDMYICLENLGGGAPVGIDSILELIRRVGSPKFAICLDTGHLNRTKTSSQKEFLVKGGSLIKALHVHDNDGGEDQHILPFSRGNIDWQDFMDGLREINYKGLFNYEIPGDSKNCPREVLHEKTKLVKITYDYLMKM